MWVFVAGKEGTGQGWKGGFVDLLRTPDYTASGAAGGVLGMGHGAFDVAVAAGGQSCEERQSCDGDG